ncbi:MAG: hypothetical protein E7185_09625 [Erysipelotrichaceae bacterium]|nr:hypothetical protein [Erysipelotrichaceae bacterium]
MANTKTTQTKKRSARKKRTGHFTGFLFWICLILLVTPPAVLGWILFSSQQDTGKPVLGNRYDGDLDPAITKDQMTAIENGVAGLDGIEAYWVEMPTATLRVYANIDDGAGADAVRSKADEIYGVITSVLDPSVYFTQADGKKMYDVEVHVFNHWKSEETDDDGFVYVIKSKSSSMSEPRSQLVSEPLDAELAQQLRDETAQRLAEEEAARAAAEAEAQAQAEAEAQGETEGEEAPAEEAPAEESSEGEGE